ncbi:endo-1,3-1,4-beta-glycanase ExsH [Variibacter gotjawalensis]|uniref:Endo-1,3-1,4-beta-glycanase ExsH n=1 Tax=Variibacter gotjawalensis TaxID=1333996 RepID=A0A0S3PTV9_9BRAD|nr:family 16 glycosylhydrolase [Variibacter gotjawalensis]NIK49685.1 beta-glucanase (GH16 family) [Variibacter gotjawalensis]RZS45697.1 hemolysin type calcium-binding protein [Variibacter gotjawalensis]BAT59368.1 endo-1,3-1,4-beta-glycanase ExsH [Variibacter gotjawalensis]
MVPSGYTATFTEEFNELSVSAWGPGTRWIAHTPWNGDFGDATFADPANGFPFTVTNGVLRIEASKSSGQWQSGLLASVDAQGHGFSQQYGYFEMRAQLPSGAGVWPAFWLIGLDRSQFTAEIDVMEQHGSALGDRYSSAVHTWYRDGSQPSASVAKQHIVGANVMTSGFHDYGVNVTPTSTIFYFDGQEVWRTATPESHKQPMYILLDLALGGGFPINQTPNPSYMYVDYVHVYQTTTQPTDPPPQGGIVGTSGNDNLKGTAAADMITGLAGNDALNGLAGNDTLDGGAGNDILTGGLGADWMIGGAGDDIFYVDDIGDRVSEAVGEGYDTVRSSVSFTLPDNVEKLTLSGDLSTSGTGNALANELYGDAGANTLSGLSGADKLFGLAGNDRLLGGDQNDTLIGGLGVDTMTGGAGADRFQFDVIGDSGVTAATRDFITDFSRTENDILALSGIDANTLVAGNQAFAFIGTSAFSRAAGQLRYGTSNGMTIVEGDVNGDGIADFSVALQGIQSLTVAAFIL